MYNHHAVPFQIAVTLCAHFTNLQLSEHGRKEGTRGFLHRKWYRAPGTSNFEGTEQDNGREISFRFPVGNLVAPAICFTGLKTNLFLQGIATNWDLSC